MQHGANVDRYHAGRRSPWFDHRPGVSLDD